MALPEKYIINYAMLLPALSIILFLSFLEKRKCRQNKCNHRPALIIPFPSLDSYENRVAYVVAFGTTLNTTAIAIFHSQALGFQMPFILKAIEVLFQALLVCVLCFPYFACVSTRYRAAGAIINIMYCLTWFGIDVAYSDEDEKSTISKMKSSKAISVLMSLPNLICQIIFVLYCCYILYRCYTSKCLLDKHIPGAVKPHQVDHVRWVFRKSKDKLYQALLTESQTSFIARIKSKKLKLFTNYPFFKYPTKLVSILFFQLITTYLLALATIYIILLIDFLFDTMDSHMFNILSKCPIYSEGYNIIIASLSLSLIVAVFQSLFNITMFARNYRYHMLKFYQGDKDFVSDWKIYSSSSNLTSSVNFVGYAIIYTVWCFVLSFLAVGIILIVALVIIYMFYKFNKIGILIQWFFVVLSFPLLGQLFRLLMFLLSKKCLLQRKLQETDKEHPLNVDNRKLFEVLSYFYLYLSLTGGIFSCLRRFILSAAFGFFSLGRLDKSIYSRDVQKFDGAYATYVAMLHVDNAHNNPSMRLFAHLLWSKVLVTRLRNSGGNDADMSQLVATLNHRTTSSGSIRKQANISDIFILSDIAEQKSKLATTRWFLAYTLINNPQLRAERRKKDSPLKQASFEEINLQIETTT
ncbi:stimulated by retinoic acid gene 6 protein-like isoform X2 [Biomphalaria glabrata]|uniref:Stimulated by retinoic acid gene 6 protein-like isoform X2 n=1 Tax=Biomphalaria glabrata TaxID=6526 RepID=A0A9W2ZF29_BIOGL|nr:stimulated by retinoic acid gene 6 protein-like isoform X2 [Biomphalaria glabrata]